MKIKKCTEVVIIFFWSLVDFYLSSISMNSQYVRPCLPHNNVSIGIIFSILQLLFALNTAVSISLNTYSGFGSPNIGHALFAAMETSYFIFA